MSSAKVAPADPATADVDDIHAETHLRNNFFEKRGKDIYAGGCDIRKTIKYTHMREASKKGFFEWYSKQHLHFVLSISWTSLLVMIIIIALGYAFIFGLLIQVASAIDAAVYNTPNQFAPGTESTDGVPLFDGRGVYGAKDSTDFTAETLAPTLMGFMLSMQTFLTIGYGVYGPTGFCTQAVIVVELGIGLVVTAIVTGLPYLKFSIPYPSFAFSEQLVVDWADDRPSLSCRVMLKRPNDRLMDTRVRMDLIHEDISIQGALFFKLDALELVSPTLGDFRFTTTVRHVLDRHSPLWQLWKRQMISCQRSKKLGVHKPFVQITVLSMDTTFQSEILDTHLYFLGEDVHFDHGFEDQVFHTPDDPKYFLTFMMSNLSKIKLLPEADRVTEMQADDANAPPRLEELHVNPELLAQAGVSQFRYPVLHHSHQDLRAYREGEGAKASQPPRTLPNSGQQPAGPNTRRTTTQAILCCRPKEKKKERLVKYVGNDIVKSFFSCNNLLWFCLNPKYCRFCSITASAFVPLLGVSFGMFVTLLIFDEGCHGLWRENGRTGIYSSNCTDISSTKYFEDLFYFSMQTVSTVGYGSLAPYTVQSQIISAAFGLVGFVVMAFWCGMIFSVYAQPNAIIVKSDVACITTFNTERRLVFRVASAWRMRPIVQGSVRLYAWFIPQKSAEGKKKRGALSFQQTELKLKRDGEHPFLRMPASFIHVMKEQDEPGQVLNLFGLTPADWEERRIQLCVTFTGWDSCLGRTVYESWDYTLDKIKFDRHFVDVVDYDADRSVNIDMRNFHSTCADSDFDTRWRVKFLFISMRKLLRRRRAMKAWLKRVVPGTNISSIIRALQQQDIDALPELRHVDLEGLKDLGLSGSEAELVQRALHQEGGHVSDLAGDIDLVDCKNAE